ncbi:uncharacterized protein L3040_008693 [Drepanopeziza brunnea f. sp. 'multigermtubi']|uniref:Uncharacterized protein n=1 Tax=Marssonina brunnea f. sp. multigermtubi (strain MB_m1) TaxID=1072389 RepID=K1X1B0_MARBU|nr:uncharacterized protein MBM_03049 [Drepanopeziza brunnea f. sp. 'multigermtubi' MB_m1]EKD18807.1 hypothetical protein MBM_03049 [Drepanopeziza brunnea f. sp. 'multigermtubi' MB_m1]KAJ5033581.1 hypothetical protein L3040_008693 [Drepanopeziza brunnea f. sp. 'multigermtubi']
MDLDLDQRSVESSGPNLAADAVEVEPTAGMDIDLPVAGGTGFQEQVRVLTTRLEELKWLINMHFGADQGEVADDELPDNGAYLARVRSLEGRIRELAILGSQGRDAETRELAESLERVASERNQLDWEINGEGGYVSEIQRLRALVDPDVVEAEIIVQMNAAIADGEAAEEDRKRAWRDNDHLRERIATLLAGFQSIVAQRDTLQTERKRLQAHLDRLEDQGVVNVGELENADEAVRRNERRDVHHRERLEGGVQADRSTADFGSAAIGVGECENQLALARSERDSAIKQNEEARRHIATRTAERNGAHQRIKFLEEQARESRDREVQLHEQLRRQKEQEEQKEQTEQSQLDAAQNPASSDTLRQAKQTEIELLKLKKERDATATEIFNIQYERDAARDEARVLGKESAKFRTAAETADAIAVQLRHSLDAAHHAALAERSRADEARRTQNRLRVERESVRIEANKLRAALAASHEISLGLVRHGNISVGDLVHIREERDLAASKATKLHDALIKAQEQVGELQKQLDECAQAEHPAASEAVSLQEYHWIMAERDRALIRVEELERLLKELEEDYRQNLDQWERQTKSDEREISASHERLRSERERSRYLAAELQKTVCKNNTEAELEAAETRLRAAGIRAAEAEDRANAAEARAEVLETQLRRLTQHDLTESQQLDAEHHRDIRDDASNPSPLPPLPERGSSAAKTRSETSMSVSMVAIPSPSPGTRTSVPPFSARSHVSFASMQDDPAFPSLVQPQSSGHDEPVAAVQTGPTTSAQTIPRATRNPAPDYGGVRKRKRKRDGESEPSLNEGDQAKKTKKQKTRT